MYQLLILSTLLLSSGLLASNSLARNKIIYGQDGRLEYAQVEDSKFRKAGQAVAAMIKRESLELRGGKFYFKSTTLKEKSNICPNERFANQKVPSDCTGFLVSKRHILTAAHCLLNTNNCPDEYWSFQLDLSKVEQGYLTQSDLYKCKNIEMVVTNLLNKVDFALIELDREVTNVEPLKLSSSLPDKNESVVAFGHPNGVPLKFTKDANVVSNVHSTYFKTNLDTFTGNSGSPVFLEKDGTVAGILVRGAKDYNYDNFSRCFRVNNCSDVSEHGVCYGETATSMSAIIPLIKSLIVETKEKKN